MSPQDNSPQQEPTAGSRDGEPMVRLEGFCKVYDGHVAVRDLDLEVHRGEIMGIIGPNGAGKTTTFRFLATLLEATSGNAWIDGLSVRQDAREVRRRIGYMPDSFGVYDGMRVWEFLDFFALAYGISRRRRQTLIDQVLELLDLQSKSKDMVTSLSRGMKQRLCLAKTLVHDPPLLILDEPASGLDPRARLEITELLRELQRMGKTILISSHILHELRDCCTRLAILERGRLLAQGPVAEILERCSSGLQVEVEVVDGMANLEKTLDGDPRLQDLRIEGKRARFAWTAPRKELADLHSDLVARHVRILWFQEVKPSLEDAFMALTRGEVQ